MRTRSASLHPRVGTLIAGVLTLLAAPAVAQEKKESAPPGQQPPAVRPQPPGPTQAASAPAGVALFNGRNLDGWKLRDAQRADTWKVVSAVALDAGDPKKLTGTGAGGTADAVLFRQPVEHGSDLYTTEAFGDCALRLELMVPQGSNSGVYLLGQYEVQVFDSFGKPAAQLSHADLAGIYSVAAPRVNASRPPGQWQTLEIVFRAPRFDAGGQKIENARFVRVTLNGQVVQENVEVNGPTGGELPGGEKPTGPLLLQGDHGVVAYRNLRLLPMAAK